MEIKKIYDGHLYAVKFDNETDNAYELAFSFWQDQDMLIAFFSDSDNAQLLKDDFWQSIPIPSDIEDLSSEIIDESFDLEEQIESLESNTSKGQKPDFDEYFKEPLEGKYKFLYTYVPQKAYGTNSPSMLRLYSIKLKSNCYIIVYGGIKLTEKIQDTPKLNRELFPRIDKTIQFLRENYIIEIEDIDESQL